MTSQSTAMTCQSIIGNQKLHLTCCITHDCWNSSALTQALADENELYGTNQP